MAQGLSGEERMKTFLLIAAFALVADVREAIRQNDWKRAEALVRQHRQTSGVTPEMLEAQSWLGRGALAAKQYDAADRYAVQTEHEATELLKRRPLDQDKSLPLALGAAIEVQAQVMVARGERDRALPYLREQVKRYKATSIRERIQKNINLIDLEGKPAPPLEVKTYIGSNRPKSLAELRGRPVLLFLWAHWCPDCKVQGTVLARLMQEFGSNGLTILAPTELYGNIQGNEADPSAETRHIAQVLAQSYPALHAVGVPLSSENFKIYGVSTTPTLVLIDRAGIVRLYRPGRMTYEELLPHIKRVM
jgi:thiol-disulfide isomerase/thioredoxin